MNKDIKLNIGGGKLKIDGFINIDLCEDADLKHDLRKPLPFKDGEVKEIIAVHVIESFYKFQFLEIVKDWKRTLDGTMTIEFTDLDMTIDMYLNGRGIERMLGKWGLYGNQDIPCDPIVYHHYVYTKDELEKILIDAGFTDIQFTKENIEHVVKRDWRVICKS